MSLFHPLRKVVSEVIRLSTVSTSYSTKQIKKIAPGKIKTLPKKFEEEDYLQDPNIRKKLLDDIQRTGSMDIEEPDIESFSQSYTEYKREEGALEFKMRRNKMMRKHFKEYIEKEVNLLTYAEKEHVRYLHNMDPENWTPERISESFPISADGAIKILNSTFRARSYEDAMVHDQNVAKKIQLIKQGVIKLTPELKRKMELRSNVPLQIGAAQQYNQFQSKALSMLPQRIPGEFESLVANPQRSKKSTEIPFPYSSPSKTATEPEPELYSELSTKNDSDEFRQLKISSKKIMMLDEVEAEVSESRKRISEKDSSSADRELDYLLKLDDKTLLHDKISKASGDMWNAEDEYHPGTLCKKFKDLSHTDNIQPYQPITTTSVDDYERDITIPPELKKPGALYKIGNSYFDEDGHFLYRVI